jgi:hypothetical protein
MPNQALEQTRDSVLRHGESVGCELLNFFVLQQEAQSQSRVAPSPMSMAIAAARIHFNEPNARIIRKSTTGLQPNAVG